MFGGTFNPIHNAHLIVARTVAEQMKMDKVILIPNGVPPYKKRAINPIHKFHMICMAVGKDPIFDATSYEIQKKTKSYTIETIREYKKNLGDSIDKPYWLIGSDNLKDLKNWYRIDELIEECNFVVAGSQNTSEILDNNLPKHSRWCKIPPFNNYSFYEKMSETMQVVVVPQLEIRSTIIRQRVAQGLSIKYLVPEGVEGYIHGNNLYQN